MARSPAELEMVIIRRILRAAEQLSPASLAWLRAQLATVQGAQPDEGQRG